MGTENVNAMLKEPSQVRKKIFYKLTFASAIVTELVTSRASYHRASVFNPSDLRVEDIGTTELGVRVRYLRFWESVYCKKTYQVYSSSIALFPGFVHPTLHELTGSLVTKASQFFFIKQGSRSPTLPFFCKVATDLSLFPKKHWRTPMFVSTPQISNKTDYLWPP